ncbi:MAG TPA: ABC transporter permease [Bryobacteraceae bacterium]
MFVAWLQDLRYAVRLLLGNPGVSVAVILTMALGIGANTAMFSIVNGFLLHPLPFPQANRLYAVWYSMGAQRDPVAYPIFNGWRKETQIFSDLVAEYKRRVTLTAPGDPQDVVMTEVSLGYFDVFGASAILGRSFLPEDHTASAAPVAVLSADFWAAEFHRDPAVLGKTIQMNGVTYTVVGVMGHNAPEFSPASSVEIWIPLERNMPPYTGTVSKAFLNLTGRLQPGVSLDRARHDLDAVNMRLNSWFSRARIVTRLQPLRESLFGSIRTGLFLLLGAVGFVLLIACANTASVLMARASARVREFAIRMSLGAGTARLICQMLTESLLLALLGSLAGLILAAWGNHLALAYWPANVPRAADLPVDWRVLLFTLAVTVVAGILCGLGPSVLVLRSTLNESLKKGHGYASSGRGTSRLFRVAVVSEMVFVTLLLAGAGLMLKSFAKVMEANPGFDPKRVLTARISIPEARATDSCKVCDDIVSRLQSLHGVVSAGATSNLPLGEHFEGFFDREENPTPAGVFQTAQLERVTADYFHTMGIPLLRGRLFTEQEVASRAGVAIINEQMARSYWPGGDPVGKRIKIWPARPPDVREIVGVVGNVKLNGIEQDASCEIYSPNLILLSGAMTIVARTSAERADLVQAIRREIRMVDREQAAEVVPMDQIMKNSFARRRMTTALLAFFAGIAILLASVGIYGVISYSVSQRTRELGTRMALGATAGDIVGMVTGEGIRLTVIGIGLGVVAALALGRFIQSFLFGVDAADFVVLSLAAVFIATTGMLGSSIAAYRATTVPAASALRYE